MISHKMHLLRIICVIFAGVLMAGCDRAENLRSAANHGDAATVKQLAHDHPSWVNAEDGYGDAPLNLAVERGDPEIVEILLKAGADPNHESYRLGTPLSYVSFYGSTDMADLLLKFKANVNLNSKSLGGTPLHMAATRGDPQMLKLLFAYGANVNALKDSETPLQFAMNAQVMAKDRLQAVQLLLNHGANINAEDSVGHTPLHYGILRGVDKKILDFLVKNGAVDH